MNAMRLLATVTFFLAATSCSKTSSTFPLGPKGFTPTAGLHLTEIAHALSNPVYLASPAGDSRLFVVEQAGRIVIVENGQVRTTPFLDIRDRVTSGGEQGLLSVAFHPDYRQNGFFFVDYTDLNGDTHIERYSVTADSNVADPASAKLILFVAQPFSNHNGGLVLFGPDGMLTIGMGDGGSAGDPQGNGQNRSVLLGKLLRIDVDHGDPYAIPPDNPFVGMNSARGEIWAFGLRNPWRFSFDRVEHLLFIGDVGQNKWEEVDVANASAGGIDYGWNIMEGFHPFHPAPSAPDLTLPLLEYSHSEGCSIIGGMVYRGLQIPALVGQYVFSDYCSGWLRSFRYVNGRATDLRQWTGVSGGSVTSFGEDSSGEIYMCATNGSVYRIDGGTDAGTN